MDKQKYTLRTIVIKGEISYRDKNIFVPSCIVFISAVKLGILNIGVYGQLGIRGTEVFGTFASASVFSPGGCTLVVTPELHVLGLKVHENMKLASKQRS